MKGLTQNKFENKQFSQKKNKRKIENKQWFSLINHNEGSIWREVVCERERERERERDPPVIHTKYSENFFFLEINIVKTSFVVCCI